MENKTLIENSLLNDNDKNLLKNMIENRLYPYNVFDLSIFSKIGIDHKKNDYEYIKYENNHFFFYKPMNIWMDFEFKLLQYSNWWCKTFNLKVFIDHINLYISLVKNLNINDAIIINDNYISITKWFVTYGHFLDELFCLKEFIMSNDLTNTIPFISFNLKSNNIYSNNNYKSYCDLLFDKYYDPNDNLIKVSNLIIIKHLYDDLTFHSFPICVSNLLNDKIDNLIKNNEIVLTINKQTKNNYLFLTRGEDPPHLPRNLKNKKEIENNLKNNLVDIFNPENNNIFDMIKILKEYNNIIITWGSALTNLCFCNDNCNVIILKSDSYKEENINLFNKIILSKKIKIIILESVNNEIDPNLILKLIQ
jgi:hypothetical protein